MEIHRCTTYLTFLRLNLILLPDAFRKTLLYVYELKTESAELNPLTFYDCSSVQVGR